MENTIRDLVAYGDTIDMSARDLVWGFTVETLHPEISARVRTIIESHVGAGNISDSLLEDLMDEIMNADDTWSE